MTESNAQAKLSRQSILDRARRATVDGTFALRAYAINQLFHRFNAVAPGAWILKGGDALLTRQISTRATRDIDAKARGVDIHTARMMVQEAVSLDLGDGVMFTIIKPAQALGAAFTGGQDGLTFSIQAVLDGNKMADIKCDVVTGSEPTGSLPSHVRELPFATPGVIPVEVTVYPVVDHIADKVCATVQTYGAQQRDSSRTRDLYDLCALAHSGPVTAADLLLAIEHQRQLRRMPPINALTIPATWRTFYEQLAAKYPAPNVPLQFDEATALVTGFIDPVLRGNAVTSTWSPEHQKWES